jgi:hypothetical protein
MYGIKPALARKNARVNGRLTVVRALGSWVWQGEEEAETQGRNPASARVAEDGSRGGTVAVMVPLPRDSGRGVFLQPLRPARQGGAG